MKKILALLTLGVSLFSTELIVKKADVKISVNNELKELSKGDTLKLTPGTKVCFLDGEGKVKIKKLKQLTKKSKKCYTTPIPEGFKFEDFVKGLADSAKVAIITGDLKTKAGVSTKSVEVVQKQKGTYEIKKKQKEVVIFNDTYGPLPVTLTVYDENKNVVQKYVNEENVVTVFRVPTNILKENYRLIIINSMFEEELLDLSILVEK